MPTKLEEIASQLQNARTPEEVFGNCPEQSADCLPVLKKKYHDLARIIHPDLYKTAHEKMLADLAFTRLNHFFRQAQEKSKLGMYGQNPGKPDLVAIQAREMLYWVEPEYTQDALFNYHPCRFNRDGRTHQAVLKIVRDPHYNRLAQNEVTALKILQGSGHLADYSAYFPKLLDAFVYQDEAAEHHALVLGRNPGWYSLEEVRREYPDGIDPKDMAWIWRRLLVALGAAHKNGLLHAAVLPKNIYILPEQHGLRLCNWAYSQFDSSAGPDANLPLDDAPDWYPKEIQDGTQPSTATDIVMSAKCMLFLLGGDPKNWYPPGSSPAALTTFFRGTLLPERRAPQDAWALKTEFDDLIERLWGKRKFHPFIMNQPNNLRR